VTPQQWQKVQELFDAAAELPLEERMAYVERGAGGDPLIQREVESLLESLPGATSSIRAAIGAAAERVTSMSLLGRRLGPYRIVRELGEGGMGVVYLAERDDRQYRTQVAIKVLHAFGTSQAIARFRDERQILATLEHPGIVRLLDGGSTEERLPYLVMEHVEGMPITRFAEERAQSIRARLELFERVCAAVAYAHQKLVVHRDLKPSNILVTADGSPKLLDFGIAKILDAEATIAREARTRTGMSLLTPEYASPEQVRGAPASTATDIYSLGAVLYELCTGRPALRGTGVEALRAILEVDPPRPSTVAPAPRRRALQGDLDNIILRAMHKEPVRRYPSVERLAEDIRRHLEGRPVEARAATFAYRTGKFLRRNRVLVAAAAVVLATLGTATAVSLRQAHRADVQARRADGEAERARRRFADVRRLANSLLFEVDAQIRDLEGATAARELIVRRALEYLDGLAAEAGEEPALARELATAYMKIGDIQGSSLNSNLGRPRDGLESYGKAKRILDGLAQAGGEDIETRRAVARELYGRGFLHWTLRDAVSARALIREALRVTETVPRDGSFDYQIVAQGHVCLAQIGLYLGDTLAASRSADRCLEVAQQWRGLKPSLMSRYWVAAAQEARALTRGEAADPDAAIGDLQATVKTLEELVRERPERAPYRRELCGTLGRIAGYSLGIGDDGWWLPSREDRRTAETAMMRTVPLAERLANRDVQDHRSRTELAWYLTQFGATRAGYDLEGGLRLLSRARRIYESLPPSERRSGYAREMGWFLHCALAEPLARLGRRAEALVASHTGLLLAEVSASPTASLQERMRVPMCRRQVAGMLRALGEAAAAVELLRRTANELRGLISTRPSAISAYIGLVDTLLTLAEIRPRERCALGAQALEAWRSWRGAPTAYTRRMEASLHRRRAGCSPAR
jgi:hypothetical protein